MRNWWNLSEKKVSNIVEKFTCTYVTPTLWAAEVKSVQDSKATFDNMVVSPKINILTLLGNFTSELKLKIEMQLLCVSETTFLSRLVMFQHPTTFICVKGPP